MTGQVHGRQPHIGVILRLPNNPALEIEFTVDTGFNGFLTLPTDVVAVLRLPYVHRIYAQTASGVWEETSVYQVTLLWDGQEVDVDVLAIGPHPLLGTSLMDGFDLQIQFADGGLVTLERL